MNIYPVTFKEEIKDIKGVIKIRISKKNRKHTGKKKNNKRTNKQSTKDRVTRTQLKTGGELGCSGRVPAPLIV